MSTEVAAVLVAGFVGIGGWVVPLVTKWMEGRQQQGVKAEEHAHALALKQADEDAAYTRAWWARREAAYEEALGLSVRVARLRTESDDLTEEAKLAAARELYHDVYHFNLRAGGYVSARVRYVMDVYFLVLGNVDPKLPLYHFEGDLVF